MSQADKMPVRPSRGSPEALRLAAGNTRTLLEEAAIALFYESGSQMTTVRDITKACGMTPGAMYKHFSSKEDLLFEVIRSAHMRVLWRLDEALEVVDPVRPDLQLAALVTVLVLFHSEHRREARVANQEYRFLPEPARGVILELRREIRSRVRAVLRAGERKGIFTLPSAPKADASAVAALMIIDMAMRVSEWFDPARSLSARDLAALHVDYVMRMVGAEH